VQTVAILLYVVPLASLAPWLGVVAFLVMLAAVAITVWTGGQYVVEALKLRANGRRAASQHVQGEQP
jgi:CDP-diacylglycerol--glycerol-3-phosphate 3-phosphatidyltransferase/cardiolipin synthase